MKQLAPSIVTTRARKGRKFISIVEAAYNQAELSQDEAQRINDTAGLADHIGEFIAKNRVTDKFKNEEVPSTYGYLSGYKPEGQDLDRQIEVLQGLFPGLGGPNLDYLQRVKSGAIRVKKPAEKFFAIPNIWKEGGLPAIFGATYSEALQKVLDKIFETREGKFQNYRVGQIDEQHIRQPARTIAFFKQLSEAQGNPDILIVPAQFGILHRGRSVRRAAGVFLKNELHIGSFGTGIMLLTHTERLQEYDDLWIDTGDEFNDPDSGVRFGGSPYFRFSGGGVRFVANRVGGAVAYYGSASAFLPKSLLFSQKHSDGCFCFYLIKIYSRLLMSFVERIQPPNILPISSMFA